MNALWPLWAGALGLLLLTLGGLLWPLLRESSVAEIDTRERLRRIYRTQREELERDYRDKALSETDYAQAVEELERRLLADMASAGLVPASAPNGKWRRLPAALLSVLLPLGAVALYIETGDPRAAAAIARGAPDIHANTGVDVDAMVARLEARLQRQPDELEGWVVLARSREALEQFDAATAAYQRAIALAQQQGLPSTFQARLHADLADAMASAHGGAFDPPVKAALNAALKLDPDQPKALALAGTAAARSGDHVTARRHWQRLLGLLEPDSDMALRVESNLAGLTPGAKPQRPEAPPVAGLSGSIRLDPALSDRVQADDTVFIVVRSPSSGRMPVAVLRMKAAQLPARFSVDDSNAMSPDMPISRFKELTIEARISRSGAAQRQPGQPVSLPLAARNGDRGLVLLIGAIEP